RGYRVLVVDRATFPSDTVSTYFILPPGVAALSRWGLLDRVRATGCPPVTTYSFDFGPFKLSGTPRAFDGNAQAYGPRRTVLDKILVDAAAEAGAEVREKFTVQELVTDDDGRVTGIRGHDADGATVAEDASVVVGAAGYHKDPLTAFGITDAFHDVDLLVNALDQSFTEASSFDDAMSGYQQQRDEAVTPMFELTLQFAAMQPPPPEMQALLGAVH